MILVLGNATVDLGLRLPALPEGGETVLADAMSRGPGGKGLNQACAIARAGADVLLVAPVGRDADAAFLKHQAAGVAGLACRWIACDAPSDLSCLFIDRAGENVIASTAACARGIRPDEVPSLLTGLGPGSWLVLQGNLTADTTLAAARHGGAAGATVVLNTAPIDWPLDAAHQIIAASDWVISNGPEAITLTGTAGDEAVARIGAMARAGAVVTLGRRGAILHQADRSHIVDAVPVAAIDTSGAGDTFVGYFVATLASGASPVTAANRASRAASVAVGRSGTFNGIPEAVDVDRR